MATNLLPGFGIITETGGTDLLPGYGVAKEASAAVAPPTGHAYALTASRAGIPSAVLWQTTTRTFAVPLSAIVAEAATSAPSGGGGAQARVMVMA